MTPGERFWRHVKKSDGCWEWSGRRDGDGYGRIGGSMAHRVSWAMANGPIPGGLCIMHSCDNRACVRPDHLVAGTQLENLRDRDAKGRQAAGSGHGRSLLTEADVRLIRALYAARLGTRAELAKDFGVSRRAIGHICTGTNWPHAGGPITRRRIASPRTEERHPQSEGTEQSP